ncbi:MAG: alpha-galactosidase [Clostridia bacterium]|nr:alpha-galactosidase [Clostridia bacterium]
MLLFSFQNLQFEVLDNGTVILKKGFGIVCPNEREKYLRFTEIQVLGENHPGDGAHKLINMSETDSLRYISHKSEKDFLTIIQENLRLRCTTVFQAFEGTGTIRILTEITNLTPNALQIPFVSSFILQGFGGTGRDYRKDLFFHRFLTAQHAECRGERRSFADAGIANASSSFRFANVGSWSTKEQLPQGILEDAANQSFLMFQIESNHDWYYEVGIQQEMCYLNLSGGTERYHSWVRILLPGETYRTPAVALAYSDSYHGVLVEMTAYRRLCRKKFACDEKQPVIFNEYMHLRWDAPSEEKTMETVPVVAKTGAAYYVIDCGWHDDVSAKVIYRHVGAWKESRTKFPSGIRHVAEYIRSYGMKPGLWIEPEVVGQDCAEMLEYYDDDCFLQRRGKRICELGRYLLDFRSRKVRNYLSETIRRMVEDYGAEYIKIDYNQDCGIGTDRDAFSAGAGLEDHAAAFLSWVEEQTNRFPHVLFETCASGGMRADYKTLSRFALTSSSDQTRCELYPYIVGNLFTAVLPEQAGIWCYPADTPAKQPIIGHEKVILNGVNAILGRMHLASDLKLLNEREFALLTEAIRYSIAFAPIREKAVPYLPLGYARFGAPAVATGLLSNEKLYLAVWNLQSGSQEISIPLSELHPIEVRAGYPASEPTDAALSGNLLTVRFSEGPAARLLEISLRSDL